MKDVKKLLKATEEASKKNPPKYYYECNNLGKWVKVYN